MEAGETPVVKRVISAMSQQYVLTCSCGHRMTVREEHFGHKGKCSKCGNVICATRETVTPLTETVAQPPASASEARPAEAEVAAEWNVGDVILDLYEVTDILGAGGMGKVYKVHQRDWDLDLAAKVPRPDHFKTPGHKENFVRECHAWMDLGLHPHIVTCHYVRVLGGIPRVFAEYVDGGSLEDWIQNGRLYEGGPDKALERILSIAIQFAWGLHHAHEKGLIHQDVKPANVMLTSEGTVKVTDFGLANARAAAGESEAVPKGGSIMASYGGMTPAYCSPEQAENAARRQAGMSRDKFAKLTRRTDIYSWAVSVFEMFTGGVTWPTGNVVEQALESYLQDGPPDDDLPAMPESVAALLRECLKQKPEARPKDMAAIADRLTRIYKDVIGHEYPQETPTPPAELADVLNNKAVSFLELGQPEVAERLLEAALQIEPTHPETCFNVGLLQWRRGQIDDVTLLDKLDQPPNDCKTNYFIGLIHKERLDADSASRAFTEAEKSAVVKGPDSFLIPRGLTGTRTLFPAVREFERPGRTEVSCVSLSRDGSLAVSGHDRHVMLLWDVASGREVREFERTDTQDPADNISATLEAAVARMRGNAARIARTEKALARSNSDVLSVCFSSCARWVVSGSSDELIRIWDVASGKCLGTLRGHQGAVRSVIFSGDSRRILSGASDGTLRLWDAETGECVRVLQGHTDEVTSVDLGRGSTLAISGSFDRTLRVWDVKKGQCVALLRGHSRAVTCVSLGGDGSFALSGGADDVIIVWDLGAGLAVRMLRGHKDGVKAVTLSKDNKLALSGGGDPTVRLWDVASGRCVRTFGDFHTWICSLSLSEVGDLALAAERSSFNAPKILNVHAWRSGLQKSTRAPWQFCRIRSVEQIADSARRVGQLLSLANKARNEQHWTQALVCARQAREVEGHDRNQEAIRLWHVLTQRFPRRYLRSCRLARTVKVHDRAIFSTCLVGGVTGVLSASFDHTLRFWDPGSGQLRCELRGHEDSVSCVAAQEALGLAVSGSADTSLRIWDLGAGHCKRILTGHAGQVSCVVLSSDGRWIVSASKDHTVRLWEAGTGRCVRVLAGPLQVTSAVSITRDWRWMLSGGADLSIVLWNLTAGRPVRQFEQSRPSTWSVSGIAFGEDGSWALSGSFESIKLWNTRTGNCVRVFEGHGGVECVCLSSDGKWAASGSIDETVRLWCVETGECVRILRAHTDRVTSVHLSQDAHWLVSGSYDGTVRLWELDWELEAVEPADWDEGARPYLLTFLTLHTPYAAALPQNHEPSEAEITRALTREGRPSWTDEDFKQLLHTLGCAGYGWLRPEGVKRELERMTTKWEGPPPLEA